MKYVEWNEPYDADGQINLICRMTVEDATAAQYKALEASGNTMFKYKSDEDALQDFIVVRWARIVED